MRRRALIGVAIFGIDRTLQLIHRALAGELVAA